MLPKESEILAVWDEYKSYMSVDDFLIAASEHAPEPVIEEMRRVIARAEGLAESPLASRPNYKIYAPLYRSLRKNQLPRCCGNCSFSVPGLNDAQILPQIFLLRADSLNGQSMLTNLWLLGESQRW